MDEPRDDELVTAACGGDRAAFATLVERHYARTRALARALVGDEGEDVTQEAVLQAYLGLEHLREPARFGAWLYGIAANLARMRLRRAGLRPVLMPPSAVDGFEAAETAALVREALAVLPSAQREAVLMHDVAGYTAGEIAERVGGSSGAVRVRLHRGRRELRKRLAAAAPARRTRKEKAMVEVELLDVVVRIDMDGGDNGGPKLVRDDRIVRLRERGGDRVLPIWIGPSDGDSLAMHLGSEPVPRPLTADLMARLLEAAGARVERIVVSKLVENTFYGVVHVVAANARASELDARPSDAINLAVRVGAPIYVEQGVFDESALVSANLENLDTELAKGAKRLGIDYEQLGGEWRSLSPELVRAVGSFRPWRPPVTSEEGTPVEGRENE